MRAVIVFAALALSCCTSNQEQYQADMQACVGMEPTSDGRNLELECERRALLNAERRDAATAAALEALGEIGNNMQATGAAMMREPGLRIAAAGTAATIPGCQYSRGGPNS